MATRLDQTTIDMVSYMKLSCFWALKQTIAEPYQLLGPLVDLCETRSLANCLVLDTHNFESFDYLADIQDFHNHSKCNAQKHNDSQEVLFQVLVFLDMVEY